MNDNAKKWVAVLRSGEFEQTQKMLTEIDAENNIVGCCCMGVACEMFDKANPGVLVIKEIPSDEDHTARRRYNGEDALPPIVVINWLGLRDKNGSFVGPNHNHCLTGANDKGQSFNAIADLIEKNDAELFEEMNGGENNNG